MNMGNTTATKATGSCHDDSALEVRRAVRELSIDRFTVEAVLDSYLFQVTKKDVVAADRMMTLLETDNTFVRQSHKAVLDGLVFSTFVSTLDDDAFVAALDEVEALDDAELEAMRVDIFEFGVQVACQLVGGAPTHGKTLRRSAMFRDLVKAFVAH